MSASGFAGCKDEQDGEGTGFTPRPPSPQSGEGVDSRFRGNDDFPKVSESGSPSAETQPAAHAKDTLSQSERHADQQCAWRLAVVLIVLYLLTAAGRLTSLDGIAMYRTAQQLVSAGQVAVPPSPEAPAGRDGRHYAKYGLGQSLVELPLVLLGHTLATLTNQPDDRLTQFWASLTNTFVSVGIVLVWWRFARDLGYARPVATAGAVTLASASLLWPYARTDFSEPLLALTLLSTAWCLYRWHCAPPRARAWALAAGACGGFAFVTKPTAAILCPAFALYALWLLRSSDRSWVSGLRSLAASLGPLVVAGGFVLAFNYYRFGSVLDLGYGDEPATGFTTPLLTGVALLLTSSGKGLLWFCPAVVAGLWGWRAFARAHPAQA
ncbi:MAG: glycosyltransferase family 39 protein, partial [Chloroflexota bacterium]|nr:glycosyltransferase family 39 protein [Chloroflexota bacterium]